MTTRIPLERDQHVTMNMDGRPAVITEVHRLDRSSPPTAYTVRLEPSAGEEERLIRVQPDAVSPLLLVQPDAVWPTLLDSDDVYTKLQEASASGLVDGPDAPYNWAALRYARLAEALFAETIYLRRRLELTTDATRLGPRDGAVAAGADALLEYLRRRGELDAEVDGATTEDLLNYAAVVVDGALPVLAPFAGAVQELHDLLPGPCPLPDLFQGFDQCAHGAWDRCPVTRAAWIAAGLDPVEEKARIVFQARRDFLAEGDR